MAVSSIAALRVLGKNVHPSNSVAAHAPSPEVGRETPWFGEGANATRGCRGCGPAAGGATVAAAPEPRRRPAVVQIRSLYAVHNVWGRAPSCPSGLVRSDGSASSTDELGEPNSNRPKPFHFEIYFGKESLRDQALLEAVDEARKTKQVVVKGCSASPTLCTRCPPTPEGARSSSRGSSARPSRAGRR
jgi:hypothetical protein